MESAQSVSAAASLSSLSSTTSSSPATKGAALFFTSCAPTGSESIATMQSNQIYLYFIF